MSENESIETPAPFESSLETEVDYLKQYNALLTVKVEAMEKYMVDALHYKPPKMEVD